MNLIVIPDDSHESGVEALSSLLASQCPLAGALCDNLGLGRTSADLAPRIILCPEAWSTKSLTEDWRLTFHNRDLTVATKQDSFLSDWVILADGRFACDIDFSWLIRNLSDRQADVITIHVSSEWNANHEKACFMSNNKLYGFRRRYSAISHINDASINGTHFALVRAPLLQQRREKRGAFSHFSQWVTAFRQAGCRMEHMDVPGDVLDLSGSQDLLNFCRETLDVERGKGAFDTALGESNTRIDPSARFYGPVSIGKDVKIENNCAIIGPTIICDGAQIESGAVIRSSVLCAGVSVSADEFVDSRIASTRSEHPPYPTAQAKSRSYYHFLSEENAPVEKGIQESFRHWPWLTYMRWGKRLFDIVVATMVLVLFLPVIPILALVIKLTSQGPVFFGHKREGLHGKPFTCWKFRTMIEGADDLQATLRVVNEVDGPQFKMEDDPRINNVGRFLRETNLDEIPQFFNVLLGQMSVVGPRPSPEAENALCPSWRDARLSVCPGITGLWQVHRTRIPEQDFQEWVYYDTRYVKQASFKEDIWICWQTFLQLTGRFFQQF
jgi:lipopolysaccharide/colanic/teichoic acid biosynthesis glycosyltransferase